MYLDYNLKVLLWCIFIGCIISLAYIGATTTVKEGLEGNGDDDSSCACFDKCEPGTHKTSPDIPVPHPSKCCKPNPTCDSIGECPTGRQFKPNYKELTCEGENCKQNECCEPIPQENCLNFTCEENASRVSNYKDVVCVGDACTDKECCIPNPFPTCFGNNVKCPDNFYPKKDFQEITCADYECKTNECCLANPTCGKFECAEGSYLTSPTIICEGGKCSQSKCCTPNPKCSTFQCEKGYIQKPNADSTACSSKQCNNCECCVPMPPSPCPPPSPPTSPTDVNVYYPGMTVVAFNEEGKQKGNGSDNNPSPYAYWATPQHPNAISQTPNMFASPPTGFLPLGGEVYDQDPFSSNSPPCTNTHFGPTIMDPTFIRG